MYSGALSSTLPLLLVLLVGLSLMPCRSSSVKAFVLFRPALCSRRSTVSSIRAKGMAQLNSLESWLEHVQTALDEKNFIRVSLSTDHPAFSGKKSDDITRKIAGKFKARLISGKGHKMQLSVIYEYDTSTITKNYPLEDAKDVLRRDIEPFLASPAQIVVLKSVVLFTSKGDWILEYNKKKKEPRLYKTKPTFPDQQIVGELNSTSHDRQKRRRLLGTNDDVILSTMLGGKRPQGGAPSFLYSLGILNDNGQPRKGMSDKYRQIEKFVEILENLLGESEEKQIKLLDAGCGKGYLTFACYEFLVSKGYEVQVQGVDIRQDVVDSANKVAQSLDYEKLQFVRASISDLNLLQKQEALSAVDIVMALHACDTATDDAIHLGLNLGAKILLFAPCCHKEVRRSIRKKDCEEVMKPIFRHGILQERVAEIITDSIRVLCLELMGYKANIMEFVNDEVTSKNLLITAIKRSNPPSSSEKARLQSQLHQLMDYWGVENQHLVQILGL